jgi:hypothetical protein
MVPRDRSWKKVRLRTYRSFAVIAEPPVSVHSPHVHASQQAEMETKLLGLRGRTVEEYLVGSPGMFAVSLSRAEVTYMLQPDNRMTEYCVENILIIHAGVIPKLGFYR